MLCQEGTGTPDRIFLNLENVRSRTDAVVFLVYLALPPGGAPQDYPEHLAGTVTQFGAPLASRPDGAHAGNGITYVLEVTNVFDRLHMSGKLAAGEGDVKLVPTENTPEEADVTVSEISIYRLGG
ncbi:hypothetical protein J4E08_00285 [Sagittula sp. NFXS13]|uniref:DUF7868 domain-containing protein n=1 Tax=Sagittula sp. NFXS13 TaxID=2819095 RepID=UPI0032DE7BAA